PTVQDVAKALGVSVKTVERDLKMVRPDMKEAQGKLEAYQTQLQKHLPIKKRVELIADIAKDKKNRFAQLKAIERADDIDGIIPEIERLKVRRNDEPGDNRPLIVFKGGMNIAFGPTTTGRDSGQGLRNEPGCEGDPPAMRNVTPEPTEPRESAQE